MKSFTLKSLVAATCLLGSAFTACAESSSSSVWKVSKGQDHIYVGGTVHILPVSEFPLPSQFDLAYKNSDSIVLEADLPDATDQQGQMAMMQAMMFQNGQTLKDVLSKEVYEQVDAYFKGFGGSLDAMAQFKPGMVATIMVGMEAQRNNMAGDGVDAYFDQLASKDGKSKEYLETLDFQLNMFANMGQGDEDQMMKTNLEYMPKFKELLVDMIRAWRQGDDKTLSTLVIDKMKKESPSSFKTVMTDRNHDWIPKIEAMFGDADKEFVLVGVGHLVGEDNVLALLEKQGYKVERL